MMVLAPDTLLYKKILLTGGKVDASRHIEFDLGTNPVAAIARFVEDFCAATAMDRAHTLKLALVVEELVTNTINHGMPAGREAQGRLWLRRDVGRCEVLYEDTGIPFNPLAEGLRAPLEGGVHARPVGGLGLHLLDEITDERRYEFRNGWNRLSFTVHLRRESAA